MYCKHCGKEIADDSAFCQYCGGKQTKENDENTAPCQSVETQNALYKMWVRLSKKQKLRVSIYGLWVVLNLYWLFGNYSKDSTWQHDHFFPYYDDRFFTDYNGNFDFSKFDLFKYIDYTLQYYDFSEFIVYVFGVPLLIYVFRLCKEIRRGKKQARNK